MARRTTYIVVEGPHDVEFIGRILRKGPHAFHYLNTKSKVDPFWHPLIPSTYPVGLPPKDFLRRVPMPIFYQNATHTVAVQSAGGISNIVARLEESLATPGMPEPDGIGLILPKKATIASATAILKPGRTSQVSVNDNRWIDPPSLALPKVKAVADWLEQLVI